MLAMATPPGDVEVFRGPTPIPNGDAISESDITVQNEHFAISFAVESRPPWGVARGGILDLSILDRNGNYGEDIASLIDFMPDNWSSWPTTYQNVTVREESADRAVIHVERDWHDVVLETTFTVKRGKSTVHIYTEITNRGDDSREDILSGYILWADGGYFFNRPGMNNLDAGEAALAKTDWTASYEKEWSLAFHAPFATHIDYGGQDQYRKHTLLPGETASFEGWVQIIPEGNLGSALEFESDRKQLETGKIQGTVKTCDGDSINEPILLVYKDGVLYSWYTANEGHYKATLPAGEYIVSAIAENHSESSSQKINVKAGEQLEHNFNDLQKPGQITFNVESTTGAKALDAQIKILEGQTTPVEYLGRSMIFTDLDQKGSTSIRIAPGNYIFELGAGSGFISSSVQKELQIESGESIHADVSIPVQFTPADNSWYSADLHHHSDVLDGSTPTKTVMQAQLAAGLDLVFLSDHDSNKNHVLMDSLAATRDVPFIPSMEVSPSWGHFNVFPLNLGTSLSINPSEATATEIFEDAKSMGAEIISVNHPYIPYGWFHSLKEGSAPREFDPGFDLVELNIGDDFSRVFDRLYSFWNRGLKIYLTAGSDTHDVWTGTTGRIRMMVHVPDGLSVEGYVNGLKNGHAYATTGPLIDSEYQFGTQLRMIMGEELKLPFRVMSVNGLKSATLIGNGETIELKELKRVRNETSISFLVQPSKAGWYSIIVEDQDGKKAYSNPIWVIPVDKL